MHGKVHVRQGAVMTVDTRIGDDPRPPALDSVEHSRLAYGQAKDGQTADGRAGDVHMGDGHTGDGHTGDARPPYSALLSSTLRHDLPVGVAVVGADGRIRAIDLTGLQLTDPEPAEPDLEGLDHLASHHAPDALKGRHIGDLPLWNGDSAPVEDAIAWALLGETHHIEVTTGQARHARTISVRVGSHPQGAALLFQDISRWAIDREVRTATLEELNHRVKNMLTLVASIVNLNLRRASSLVDAQQRIHKRLAAYGRSQDLVFRKGLDAADLAEIVRFALEPFSTERLDLDIPPCPIPARMAVTLNLALHELALNATKYGAWSVGKGRVRVAADVGPLDAQTNCRSLVLRWEETGGPLLTSADPAKGFGSVLTTRVVASQFQGKTDVDYAPGGLRWQLIGIIDGGRGR